MFAGPDEPVALVAGLALGAGAAVLLASSFLRLLTEAGLVRENWRGRRLPFPAGALIAAAGLVALSLPALVEGVRGYGAPDERALSVATVSWMPLILGAALLGMVDDLIGRSGADGTPRGWRGHVAGLARGSVSTGVLKVVGIVGLAALVLPDTRGIPHGAEDRTAVFLDLSIREWLVAVALLAATTNLLNLLDTRPGRASKALALVVGGACLGAWTLSPATQVAPFLGAALAVGWLDLRERTMLGDTGSNLIGALAAVALVVALEPTGQLIALGIVLALSAYGEFRSLGAAIERIPLARHLDSLGRPVHDDPPAEGVR